MDSGVPGAGEVMVSRLHCPGPTGPRELTEPVAQTACTHSKLHRVPGRQPVLRRVRESLRHFHPKERCLLLVLAMQSSYRAVLDSQEAHGVLQTLLKPETPKQDPWGQTEAESP